MRTEGFLGVGGGVRSMRLSNADQKFILKVLPLIPPSAFQLYALFRIA